MKTEKSLNAEIFLILAEINNKYPELSSFLNEMPMPNNNNASITIEILENYYQSLSDLLNDYSINHKSSIVIQKECNYNPNRNIL